MRERDLDELLIIFADACELFEYIYDDCHARLYAELNQQSIGGPAAWQKGRRFFLSQSNCLSLLSLIHLKRNLIRASERMMMENCVVLKQRKKNMEKALNFFPTLLCYELLMTLALFSSSFHFYYFARLLSRDSIVAAAAAREQQQGENSTTRAHLSDSHRSKASNFPLLQHFF